MFFSVAHYLLRWLPSPWHGDVGSPLGPAEAKSWHGKTRLCLWCGHLGVRCFLSSSLRRSIGFEFNNKSMDCGCGGAEDAAHLSQAPEHRQANTPRRPKSTETNTIPVHLKNSKLVLDSESPFPLILASFIWCDLHFLGDSSHSSPPPQAESPSFSWTLRGPCMLFPQHSEPRPPHQPSPGRSYPEPSRGPWGGRAFCKNIQKSKGENKGAMPWSPIQIASLRLALSVSLNLYFLFFVSCFYPSLTFRVKAYYFQVNPQLLLKIPSLDT